MAADRTPESDVWIPVPRPAHNDRLPPCLRSARDGRRRRLYGSDGARKRGAVPSRQASGQIHERDGDGRPYTAADGFRVLAELFRRLATANSSMLFSTMVETLSEAKAQRGDLIPPPSFRQFAIDDRLFAGPSRFALSASTQPRHTVRCQGHPGALKNRPHPPPSGVVGTPDDLAVRFLSSVIPIFWFTMRSEHFNTTDEDDHAPSLVQLIFLRDDKGGDEGRGTNDDLQYRLDKESYTV
ncbi:hypothetical protein B0H13DRAFT_2649464 [Mycena leptocephala]|nr:hypothetical protein B0H13DRAFT_2649464 [Mycena leptocephala]